MIEICSINCKAGKFTVNIKVDGNKKELWFLYPEEFSDYICEDNIDGIVVMVLYYAMKHGHDIVSNISISSKLMYQLSEYVIPILARHSNGTLKCIHINAPTYIGERLASEPVHNATGMSCGVDSFYALYEHNYLISSARNKIDIVTYINHGSNNGQYTFSNNQIRDQFLKDSRKAGHFAAEEGLAFLAIDSNLYEIIDTKYGWDHTFRTAGIMLLFQKKISNYYYAAGFDIDEFSISIDKDSAHMDLWLLSMFSTERMTFYSQGMIERWKKVKTLLNYPPTRKYLQVCVNGEKNCSKCPKCRRTMITLYALGSLEDYKEVFNCKLFNKDKKKIFSEMLYLGKVKKEVFACENIKLLKENKKKIPIDSQIGMYIIWIKDLIKKILWINKAQK